MTNEAAAEPIPESEAARLCYTHGKDVVLIIAINHNRQVSHTTTFGRTPEDAAIASRLAAILSAGEPAQAEERKAA